MLTVRVATPMKTACVHYRLIVAGFSQLATLWPEQLTQIIYTATIYFAIYMDIAILSYLCAQLPIAL